MVSNVYRGSNFWTSQIQNVFKKHNQLNFISVCMHVPFDHSFILDDISYYKMKRLRKCLETDLMSWSSNNGREYGSWSIISSKSGFTHTGSIVYNQSGYFVVTHVDLLWIVINERCISPWFLQLTGELSYSRVRFIMIDNQLPRIDYDSHAVRFPYKETGADSKNWKIMRFLPPNIDASHVQINRF